MILRREDLATTDFSDIATDVPPLPPVTPGEMLLEEFMRPLGLTCRALASEIGVPHNRISSIVNGSRAISAETAILLGRRFGTSAEMWLNLQMGYDLAIARQKMAA